MARNRSNAGYQQALAVIAALSATLAFAFVQCGHAQSPRARDLQGELYRLEAQGGGTLTLQGREAITLSRGIVIPDGVALDLNGGTLFFTLTGGSEVGVRLKSQSSIRNGVIKVHSLGQPGIQSSIHAPIFVGEFYGSGGTPDRPSPFVAPANWRISGVTVSSDKSVRDDAGIMQGAAGIAVMAGANHGLIENVRVLDSPVMAGGILIDWGTVGPISSGNILKNAQFYRAGQAYTTHPHDIVIRNIVIGRLSRPAIAETGSFGIRLSGVDNILVDNVRVASVTEAGFMSTAGDLGYEFARSADRARAHKGIRVSNFVVDEANGAYLLRTDSYADNVGRAAARGYAPMLPPISPTDITISNFSGKAGGERPPNFGVRVNHQRGGEFRDVIATGFRRGFYIDEQVYDLRLIRPVARNSIEVGISVEHPYRPPGGITISAPTVVAARGKPGKMLLIGRSENVRVVDSMDVPIRVTRAARNASLPVNARAIRD